MKKEKIVYIVRHGETEGNIVNAVQGSDDPLSPVGRIQAEKLAERAKNIDFESILSSTYIRARETAEAIARATDKKIEFSEHLYEARHPTSLLGVLRSESSFQEYNQNKQNNVGNKTWHHSDEENFFDLLKRAGEAEKAILDHPASALMVVSHAAFMKCLAARFIFGEEYTPQIFKHIRKSFLMSNTGITVFSYKEGGWNLITWNDQSHLA